MLKTSRAIVGLLSVGLLVAAASVRAEILEQIIVKVNGDIITKTEFEQRQVAAIRQRNVPMQNKEDLTKAIAEVTPQLIFDTVDEMLLIQRGHELGYKLSDDQFKSIVDQIRKDNKLENEDTFQAALKQEGMTVADLRRSLEKQMIISRVQGQEVMQKVGITEEEARKYHTEHQDEFTKPGTVTLREIFLAVPDSAQGVNVGAEEETKAKLEAIRDRVLQGESFETVAGAESAAPSRANGGLIGPLNQGELAPALKDLLAKMKPGDITGAMRTPKGYQILKLEAVTPAKVLTAEEAHDQIADRLFEQKRIVEIKKYLVKLRTQAIIEWKNEELRKAYESAVPKDQPPAERPAGAPPAAPAKPPATN